MRSEDVTVAARDDDDVMDINEVMAARDELASMTERLIGDYEQVLPAGSVIRFVARTVQALRQADVPASQLADFAEPIVRRNLDNRLEPLPANGLGRLP